MEIRDHSLLSVGLLAMFCCRRIPQIPFVNPAYLGVRANPVKSPWCPRGDNSSDGKFSAASFLRFLCLSDL